MDDFGIVSLYALQNGCRIEKKTSGDSIFERDSSEKVVFVGESLSEKESKVIILICLGCNRESSLLLFSGKITFL